MCGLKSVLQFREIDIHNSLFADDLKPQRGGITIAIISINRPCKPRRGDIRIERLAEDYELQSKSCNIL